MKFIYNSKEIDLINCKTFWQRFRGFMLKKEADYALLFDKCNSIHTMFMKMNIDVIMCDIDNNVLYVYKNLKPNKIILPKKNVYKVIEIPANIFDIKLNTKIKIK